MSTVDIAVAEYAVWERVRALLDAHIPSISDADEVAMSDRFAKGFLDGSMDYADFGLRTCMCGEKIDGFYEYVDHLKEVFHGA